MGLTGIAPGLPEGTALPQQIPALVELDLQGTQSRVFLVCADLVPLQAGAQFPLFVDEVTEAG